MQDKERLEPKLPEGVIETPHEPEMEVPSEMVQSGMMKPTQTQFKAQVTDNSGQPVIQTPQTQTVSVQVPATSAQLDDWSKGSPANSLTWLAIFWIRMIKKAFHFGWKIVGGKE